MAEASPDWPDPVVRFFRAALPRDERGGWSDDAMTAFQIGCDALVALGQAERTVWGASQKAQAGVPETLPRWDDLCTAVLYLLKRNREIGFRLPDGSVPTPKRNPGMFFVQRIDAPPPPGPNVLAAFGCGPAHLKAERIPLLVALGLIDGRRWTENAEQILWRIQPRAWKMEVESDIRFGEALERCLETLPGDVADEVSRLSMVTPEQIEANLIRHQNAIGEERARYGPKARVGTLPDREQARRTLISANRNALDWLLFERWRLTDGWLQPAETFRAIAVFHDRLAIQMRRAMIRRLHPGSDVDEAA